MQEASPPRNPFIDYEAEETDAEEEPPQDDEEDDNDCVVVAQLTEDEANAIVGASHQQAKKLDSEHAG